MLHFLPHDTLHAAAAIIFHKHVAHRQKRLPISIDATLFSLLWAVGHCAAYALYGLCHDLYTTRFPLFPALRTSAAVALVALVHGVAIVSLAARLFVWGPASRERLASMLCVLVLFLVTAYGATIVYLWASRKATVNLLDVADAFHNAGSVGYAFHLVPQVSTNWFWDAYPLPPRYVPLKALALVSGLLAHWWLWFRGVPWFEMPLDAPPLFILALNAVALAALAYQSSKRPGIAASRPAVVK